MTLASIPVAGAVGIVVAVVWCLGIGVALYLFLPRTPRVGDHVRVRFSGCGSWCEGLAGRVLERRVTSSDGITGCLVQIDNKLTVIPAHELTVCR